MKEIITLQISEIETSKYQNWFDMSALKTEWKDYLDGDQDSSFHIWQLLSMNLLV